MPSRRFRGFEDVDRTAWGQAVSSRIGATLFLLACLAGCAGARDARVAIPFVATLDGNAFSCSTGSRNSSSDLRLYVHDVTLLDAAGRATSIRLDNDGTWQHDGVALLDFEDGGEHCADGTPGTHTTLVGRVPPGDYRGLQFVIGVPFARNHADAALAAAPLNLGRMHWGWQGGYKFLRFEGEADGVAFRFHLGSTGCEGTIDNITGCARPNRVAVRLNDFVPGRSRVQIDLATLLPDAPGASTPDIRRSCMSEPDDPRCRAPFAVLGLDPMTGTATATPSLFSVIPLPEAAREPSPQSVAASLVPASRVPRGAASQPDARGHKGPGYIPYLRTATLGANPPEAES